MQTCSQDTIEESVDSVMDSPSTAATGEGEEPPGKVEETLEKDKRKNKLKLKNPFKASKKNKAESLKDELKAAEKKASKQKKIEVSELQSDDACKIETAKKSMRIPLTSQSLPATPELDKTKKLGRASNLVRKLSLGGIGKRKKKCSSQVFSVEDDASVGSTSSSAATPTSVRRHTPDGEDVTFRSISEMSSARFDESELEVLNISEESDRPEMKQIESRIAKDEPTPEANDNFMASDVAGPAPAGELVPADSDSPVRTSASTSALPFAVSSWKSSDQIKRPIEFPSPEDHVRRRIAWIAQPTVCGSEDKEEILEEKITKLDKVSIKSPKGNETIEKSIENEVTRQHKLTVSKPSDKKFGRESPLLPGIEEDRTESYEQVEDPDPEDIRLQPESTAMTAYGDVIADSQNPVPAPSNMSQSTEHREHLYKILVIGDLGTGKTSIIKRYVHQFFSQHYRATIGVDFALKVLNWDAHTVIRLQLWDIAGQERFGNMTRVYYKEAVGAFIVFDAARVATFDAVVKWKADLDSKIQLPDGSPIPCVLLANKCDQQKEGLINTPAKMDEYCKEKGFSAWFDTSAKENINIEEAVRTLVNKILVNDKLERNRNLDSIDGERFAVDGRGNGTNDSLSTNKTCAC